MARTYTLRNASGGKSVSLINTSVPGIIARKGGFGTARLSEFIGPGQVVEEYRLVVQGASDDATAAQAQELFDLLIDAILYEKGVEDEPVYLQVQTTGESQVRFSRVISWLELEHPDVFDFPFEGDDTLDPLIVTIARQNFWSDKRPGDIGSAITLGASDGPANPTRVVISNFRDDVDITHFKEKDASVYTDINIGDELFPNPVAQYDALMWGSTDQALKCIVIPKLATAGVLTTSTFSLFYSNGVGTFAALTQGTDYVCYPGPTLQDCFEQSDEDIVIAIQPPSGHVKDTYGSVNAFWIKMAEMNAAPVYATNPVSHATEAHYAQSHPYVEIPAAAFSGDAPMKLLLRLRAPAGGDENPGMGNISRILVGARSRGLTKFVSHLNAGGDDNPADWTTTQKTDATATARNHAPAGKYCAVSYSGDSTMQPRIEWSGAGMAEYWEGEFMAIAVVQQVGGAAGDQNIKLRTYLNGTNAYDPHVDTVEVSPAMADGGYELLDLGLISVPFSEKKYDDDLSGMDLIFQLLSERTTGTSTLEIIKLILLPVKEGQSGADDPVSDLDYGPSALRGATALDIDSGLIDWRIQKYVIDSSLGLHQTETWVPMMRPIELERLGQKTRLYFVIEHYPSTWDGPPLAMTLGTCLVAEIFTHKQWLMLRGND